MEVQKISVVHFDGTHKKFAAWSRQIESIFALADLDVVLEGEKVDLEDERVAAKNKKVYHHLVVALTGKATAVIARVKKGDGRALWDELQDEYASTSKPSVHAVHQQLLSHTMQESKSAIDFADDLEEIMDQLRVGDFEDMGATEDLALAQLCKELPSEYSALVLRITADDLKWTDARRQLRAFAEARGPIEKQQDGAASAFTARQEGQRRPADKANFSSFNGLCNFCREPGHRKANCAKANKVLDDYLAKQASNGSNGSNGDDERQDGNQGKKALMAF